MTRALYLVLAVVVLEAIGFGLITPILPQLLGELSPDRGAAAIATRYGGLLALYALMQFLCAPALGALSDRFGRRPVLLVSLIGGAVDYLVMAWAPGFWVLLIGRVIAGASGASMAVVTAYIADTTTDATRAKRYGQMGAATGIGIIAGPAIGGLLGAMSLHLPFLAAACFNALMAGLIFIALPETRQPATAATSIRFADLHILASLRRLLQANGLRRLIALFIAIDIAGQIPATLWVLFTMTRFGWDARLTGLSLTIFGMLHAGVQGGLTAPLTRRFGERRCLILGMVADGLGYLLLAFASDARMLIFAMPLLSLGGIAMPALQALLTSATEPARQGELQGTLASLGSLAGIAGPLVFTALYGATAQDWPGLVWLIGVAVYGLAMPLVLAGQHRVAA